MSYKLTINLSEEVYQGLHEVIGRGRISQFIEGLVKPYVSKKQLDASYKEMSQDSAREAEANEWTENLTGNMFDETW